eukprot:CAMPEP_0201723462 /NCGR_PEP_ID=MMETSP0593-20130828/7519_1 /ASSEMBLY_ACC=CAM_ASM_000672 /TAXON_ID=267983 /ORGANISM="Skeletonema japonicum, Strain CCMP2506" /LENGTH=396 /DNA_ID=CAMNT_0048214579 /DNA_START=22 /DNA_END=1209 /DNA_ORIENTATION=+
MPFEDIAGAGFVKEITSSKRNKDIILGLVSDEVNALSIGGEHYYAAENLDFEASEGDELGWLGYYIGKCASLTKLVINDLPEDVDQRNQFLTGLNRNRSIQQLFIFHDLWCDISETLDDFFRNNKSLSVLRLKDFDIEYEEACNLASTIRDTSLSTLDLESNDLCREGFEQIIRACAQSQINDLCLSHNNISRIGCTTLGTLLGSGELNNLTSLDFRGNPIDDNSLEMLAAGLVNNTTLGTLSLSGNPSITGGGLRCLIPFLQSESCCSLRNFYYYGNDIDDAGAAALAHGLAKNKSLETLWFDPSEDDCRMTSAGWQSFATLLCDTSSVNNTYLSNHTLKLIGESCNEGSSVHEVHERVRDLLRMHENASSKDEIATRKILLSHRDLDMEPFFEW